LRRDEERLHDILEAIEAIETFSAGGQKEFEASTILQEWVAFKLVVIGEAAARLSPSIRKRWSKIPWVNIIAMRNTIVHEYFTLDHVELWRAVVNDIGTLKRNIIDILDNLGKSKS